MFDQKPVQERGDTLSQKVRYVKNKILPTEGFRKVDIITSYDILIKLLKYLRTQLNKDGDSKVIISKRKTKRVLIEHSNHPLSGRSVELDDMPW